MEKRNVTFVLILLLINTISISFSVNSVSLMNDYHDISISNFETQDIIERGDSLTINLSIKNNGMFNETNIEVSAIIRNDNNDLIIWNQSKYIRNLNIYSEKDLNFIWDKTIYCDANIEINAIIANDEYPENNKIIKNVIVSKTLFFDDMELNKEYWNHSDLTKSEDGHWTTCDSGYDNYFCCYINITMIAEKNWNDVAMIKEDLDLSSYDFIYITFDSYYSIDEDDFGYVEISKDNQRHWEILDAFSGDSIIWDNYEYNISSYNMDNIKFRFRFLSKYPITNVNWVINDFEIVGDDITIFSDDFESNTNKWIIEQLKPGDWWQKIKKSKDNEYNNKAWWCGDELKDIYPNNLNNSLFLDYPIDLSKAFEADICFSTFYRFSENDIGYIEISDDSGRNWDIIDFLDNNSNDKWIDVYYEIDNWIGGEILIRFRFTSSSYISNDGWYIDDLRILGKIDDEPPSTSSTSSGETGNNNWYISTVEIKLTATDDDGSGVDKIYYSINSGNQNIYNSPFNVIENGIHDVEFWSVDKVGNIEDHNNIQLRIDYDIPEIDITQPIIGGVYWRGRKIWPIVNFTLLNKSKAIIFNNIEITVDANDSTSGIDKIEFYIDDELKSTDNSIPYSWMWGERFFFLTHTIKIIAYDNAGNHVNEEIIVRKFF